MYTISGNDRHLAVAMLRSRVQLTPEQKAALQRELKDDPERRGYRRRLARAVARAAWLGPALPPAGGL